MPKVNFGKIVIFIYTFVFSVFVSQGVFAQHHERLWELNEKGGIVWDILEKEKIPHKDHMEMSGQKVDLILEWGIDSLGSFEATRVIRWPMLRTIPNDTHASLQREMKGGKAFLPTVNGAELDKGKTLAIVIDGHFKVKSIHGSDIQSIRTIFPSQFSPSVIDLIELKNISKSYLKLDIPGITSSEKTNREEGVFGEYEIEEFVFGHGEVTLAPGETIQYAEVRTAKKLNDSPYYGNPVAELAAREKFLQNCKDELILTTPSKEIDQLFSFSKIRASESIFSTRGGMMHGPGGYNKYLAAIWANDQAEYINPFFPFLGDEAGNESALNSFRLFAKYMNKEWTPIPSSIVAEGFDHWNGAGDRGDMAMIAYGAARFALASGNREWAEELWPLIEWCLEYLDRKKLPNGLISSDSDELEGRFPAGEANLATASLYYDALLSASYLSHELGKPLHESEKYITKSEDVRSAISENLEMTVEGFETYQYYQGNTELRSWICFPLTVGIYDRAKGTVDGLFSSQLWTRSGLLTKSGTQTVWDRSTLYALRGVFQSGFQNEGLDKLMEFSSNRLLGDHVPYVVEAYPEQNQSHLSAESGLYCRIFTEGLFGIRPTGFHKFDCTPHLPEKWDFASLEKIHAFGMVWDMHLSRIKKGIRVIIQDANGTVVYDELKGEGKAHTVSLPSGKI
ncbi:hypothetical protein [Echinicola sp. 20G]|uniref:hypothetical protein n=1 Tax=Echinicola sp. 20G TaxID=2781961 RepID=UPI001910A765|nr:hypothetical protein [Echinicola sp. 20G]